MKEAEEDLYKMMAADCPVRALFRDTELKDFIANLESRGVRRMGNRIIKQAGVLGHGSVIASPNVYEREMKQEIKRAAETGDIAGIELAHAIAVRDFMTWYALEGCLRVAALHGHVRVLDFLGRRGIRCDGRMLADAALGGKVDAVKYLMALGLRWTANVTYNAVKGGHVEVLEYALQNGCTIGSPSDASSVAIRHDQAIAFRFVFLNLGGLDTWELMRAAKDSAVVTMLKADDFELLKATLEVYRSRAAFLEWALMLGCPHPDGSPAEERAESPIDAEFERDASPGGPEPCISKASWGSRAASFIVQSICGRGG